MSEAFLGAAANSDHRPSSTTAPSWRARRELRLLEEGLRLWCVRVPRPRYRCARGAQAEGEAQTTEPPLSSAGKTETPCD